METFRTALTVIAITLLVGCKKEAPIVSYSTPKPQTATTRESPTEATAGVAAPQIPGMSYNLPTGWAAAQPHEFELARFDPVGDGTTFATISSMGPQLNLAMNVERWQKQVDMPSTPAAVAKDGTVGGVEAKTLDLKGKDKRLIVSIVARPDATIIYKLLGPSGKVETARAGFEAFLQSVHFDDATPAETPTPAAVTPAVPFSFTAPPEWSVDPTPHAMRPITWTAGTGSDRVEIFISGPITAAGFDVASNVERWQNQVGLPPTAGKEKIATSDVKIGELPGKMVDITGPAKRLVVAYGGREDLWFFKMQGPAAAVAAQKPVFEKFLASVKFNP